MEIVENTLDVELEKFLNRRLMAHLTTASDDAPRHSPVWYLWEDHSLWILANRNERTFPDRIERNPSCAVGIVDFDPDIGRLNHVGFRGQATLEPLDSARAERLLKRYFQAEKKQWNQERFGDPQEWGDEMIFVRFDPETVVARDQSFVPPGFS